jgi:phosphate transport system permease protein
LRLTVSSSKHRNRWIEFFVEALIRVIGLSSIAFVLLIFAFLLREGVPVFFQVAPGNLFNIRWYPTFDLYGTLPLILGSILITVTAIVIALPLGVATAVFVREVAPQWAREVLKPLIEVLAGIPSVVLGFFGMTIVAPLVREVLGAPTGLTAFTGALLLAYMALPTIISVAEDALDAVPKSYRDAGLAMGATEWQTIWRVVVPRDRGDAGGRARDRGDDGGDDGNRQRGAPADHAGLVVPSGADDDGDDRGRDGRGGARQRPLSRPLWDRHHTVHPDFCHQPGGGSNDL